MHPLEDNLMAYPPRAVISPEAIAPKTRTPGFTAPSASNKVVRAPRPAAEPVAVPTPAPAPTTRFDSPAPTHVPGTAAIRRAARPTPANESAYKKTG